MSIKGRQVAALFAGRLADRVAVCARQHRVKHDKVDGGKRCRNSPQFRPVVARGRDLRPLGLEVVFDADGQRLVVLDNENV